MIKNIIYVILIALLFIKTEVTGQVSFDANFENGRLDTAYLDSSSYTLAPVTNLHFRLTNALNQAPEFQIFDSVGYQLRFYHKMIYRYEGDSLWDFFDTAYKVGSTAFYHFWNFSPFTQDTVYIAYWYPYTYSDLQNYISKNHGSMFFIEDGVKGHSYQGRYLYGYQITDTNYAECYKKNVVITARQHPIESINGYFVEGMTDYLLYSQDTLADFIRRNFHFFIYPMLNPDGVYNGSGENALGQGLNREWADSLNPGGVPEIDTIRPAIWHETNQKVDWSIDIHANPGSNNKYYWWGYDTTSPVPIWQVLKANDYVYAVALSDSSSPDNTSLFQNYIQGSGVNNSHTAANWFRKSFNSIAFTFEPTSEPMGYLGNNAISAASMKSAGASLVKGLAFVYDTLPAFGGKIIISGNNLIASIAGGLKPYSYSWTGPVNGNNDTLKNASSGKYTLHVIDANGCDLIMEINFIISDYSNNSLPENVISVYPNPANDKMIISTENIWLQIFNTHGQTVHIGEYLGLNQIDISNYPKGFYFIKSTVGNTFTVDKIIKQ